VAQGVRHERHVRRDVTADRETPPLLAARSGRLGADAGEHRPAADPA